MVLARVIAPNGPQGRIIEEVAKLPVITDPRVERYILDLTDATGNKGLPKQLPAVLLDMEQMAERLRYPIVGPMVGRTLCMQAGAIGARRIFDGGAGFGYAGAWLAAGAGPGGKVICVDPSEENIARAREFHRRTGLQADFEYRVGDPVDLLERDPGPFDVVFNDVDKEHYPRFAKLAIDRLRPGGVYMADKVLWYGKVCVYGTTWDAWTSAVHQHNDWLFSQETLFSTIHDQRDGLLLTVKRS